jgi:AraC-like DNA-binding protein
VGQNQSRLLSRYPGLNSGDPEFVRQRLAELYGASEFSTSSTNGSFHVRMNHVELPSIGLFYCDYLGDSHFGFPEAGFMRQLFHLDGFAHASVGNRTWAISDKNWARLVPADAPFELDVAERYRHLALRIDRTALQQTLAALLGDASDRELVFDDEPDLNSPLIRSFRRQALFFASEINVIGPEISPIALAEMERSIITGFLLGNRHSFSREFAKPAAFAAPSCIQLVEDYIEANWDTPCDVLVLARIAGVSVRSLFRQFERKRGISPMTHLKRVRLRHARQMLLSGEAASVVAVAFRCGFHNAGHFARDYRQTFSELPSTTLRQKKA